MEHRRTLVCVCASVRVEIQKRNEVRWGRVQMYRGLCIQVNDLTQVEEW